MLIQTQTLPLLAEGRKKKWSFSSLFFALFYFVPILLSDALTTALFIKNLFVFLMFVGVYIFTISAQFSRLPLALAVLFGVSMVGVWFNSGGIVFFGFFSFIVGYYYSPKWAIVICAAAAGFLLAALGHNYDNQNLMFGAVINMCVLYGFGLMERNETLFQQKDEQHKLSLQKLSAITERERIGRDLHDIAGHALSSISLKAQVAAKHLEKETTQAAKEEVLQLATLSQNLLSEIRQAVTQIKQLGLGDEIEKATVKLDEAGFESFTEIDEKALTSLTPLQETQFSLLLKEAVTNVLRHSKGNQTVVRLYENNSAVHLQCSDNVSAQSFREGNGLTGMRERLESLGGVLSIDSTNGFSVLATMPLQYKEANQ